MARWPCQTNPFFTMSINESTRHAAAISFFSRVAFGFGSWLACRAVARGNTRQPSPFRLRRGSLLSHSRAKTGGANRDRTGDLKLAKLALSQLSYGPAFALTGFGGQARHLAGLPSRSSRQRVRLRPSGFGGTASSRFASEGWWAWEELNFRPHAYQARALTN
jgi:hypothetical protein